MLTWPTEGQLAEQPPAGDDLLAALMATIADVSGLDLYSLNLIGSALPALLRLIADLQGDVERLRTENERLRTDVEQTAAAISFGHLRWSED